MLRLLPIAVFAVAACVAWGCDSTKRPDTDVGRMLAERLRTRGRADLRTVAPGKWDRLGFFWYARPEDINEVLGFEWDHPDAAKVDLFDPNHLLLFVVVKGARVIDHALFSERELASCQGKLVVGRDDAVFATRGPWVCPENERATDTKR